MLAVLTLLLSSLPAGAREEAGARPLSGGPLLSQNTHPFYTGLPRWLPRRAGLTPPGELQLTLLQSYANNYLYFPADVADSSIVAHIDGEAWYATLRGSIGLTERLEATLALHSAAHYHGLFDPFLSWYHRLFGFPNAGREEQPANRLRFYLENGSGVIIDSAEPLTALTALQLGLRTPLIGRDGGPLEVSAGASVKAPLGGKAHPLLSSGWGASVRYFCSLRHGPFTAHSSGGVARVSPPRFFPEKAFSSWVLPYSLSLEWSFSPGWALALSAAGSTSPFSTGYYRVDNHCSNLSFGLICTALGSSTLQLSVSEEFFTFAASDVGINLLWSRRFSSLWQGP